MKLLNAGVSHWLWTKLLIACRSPAVAQYPLAAFGLLRWMCLGDYRRQVEAWYSSLAEIAREQGAAGPLTEVAPPLLTKRFFRNRGLLGVTPVLATSAPDIYVQKLLKIKGLELLEAAVAEGNGLLIVGTHFGGMGISAALLARRGHKVTILRDKQFRRWLNTPHGPQFFLGANPLFLDHDDPASDTRTILACARALREGGVIAFTVDGSHGSHVYEGELFGTQVTLRTALLELAMRCKTPVTSGFSYAEGAHVRFDLTEPVIFNHTDQVNQWCKQLCSTWQNMILMHPDSMAWSKVDQTLVRAP